MNTNPVAALVRLYPAVSKHAGSKGVETTLDIAIDNQSAFVDMFWSDSAVRLCCMADGMADAMSAGQIDYYKHYPQLTSPSQIEAVLEELLEFLLSVPAVDPDDVP